MPLVPTTTVKQVWQDVCDRIGFFVEDTTTSAGAAGGTTVIDSELAESDRHPNSFDGVFVRRDSDGEVRRVRVAGFTQASGEMTVSRAFSSQFASGATYQLTPISLAEVTRWLNEVLRTKYYVERSFLSEVLNSDFELHTSDTPDDWTAVNATGTTIKTEGNVAQGQRSLSVTDSGSGNGYERSTNVPVIPGNPYIVAVTMRAPAGKSLQAILWDVTNGEALQTLSTSNNAWTMRYKTGTIPGTCKEIQVRCAVVTASAVGYFDSAIFADTDRREMGLPGWIQNHRDVRQVFQLSWPPEDGAMDEGRDHPWPWGWGTRSSGGMGRGPTLVRTRGMSRPLWVKAYRTYPSVSAITDTIPVPREWAQLAVLERMFKNGSLHALAGSVGPNILDLTRIEGEVQRLTELYVESIPRPFGATA